MKYKIIPLEKENDLNKVLKKQKRDKEKIKILFISKWDRWSTSLVKKLQEKYSKVAHGMPVYIVNSFTMPHSFVIFKSFSLPHLVSLNGDAVVKENYLPNIYEILRV